MWIVFPLVFLSGFIDAIAGGGGLISLPAYMAAGLPTHMALGTNKFSAFLGTGISTARFVKSGYVQWNTALVAFLGALAGSAIGARAALLLGPRSLTYIMFFIVPTVAVIMLRNKGFGIREKQFSRTRMTIYSVLIGLLCGAYDGFFGPGTGIFLIMAFTSVLGLPLLTACGNGKVVNFASNIAAVTTFILNGTVNYRIGVPCMLCSILGSYLGSGFAMKKGEKLVRPVMIAVIALLMVKIIFDMTK